MHVCTADVHAVEDSGHDNRVHYGDGGVGPNSLKCTGRLFKGDSCADEMHHTPSTA